MLWASQIPYKNPPDDWVYRVNKAGRRSFQPPGWEHAGPTGRFKGRYDDPAGISLPESKRFRMVYCGTGSAPCLGEIIVNSGLLPDLETIAELDETNGSGMINPELLKFRISEEWRSRRVIEKAYLDTTLRFANIEAPETLFILRSVPSLVSKFLELKKDIKSTGSAQSLITKLLGLKKDKKNAQDVEFDRSALYGPHEFTQYIARYIYEQEDDAGKPLYDGIYYVSRLSNSWECWALFDRSLRCNPGPSATIFQDNPDLREVASVLKLPIEGLGGKLICPWMPDDNCEP